MRRNYPRVQRLKDQKDLLWSPTLICHVSRTKGFALLVLARGLLAIFE